MPRFRTEEVVAEIDTGIHSNGLTVRVRQITEDGRPNVPLFHFDIPAEHVWTLLKGGNFTVERLGIKVIEPEEGS